MPRQAWAPAGPVALAALAVAGVASAQSSVTLFGVLDASISGVSSKYDTVKTSKTGLNNSANSSSRIGFRGVEDLGGGLAASFWLEGSVGNDDGYAGGGSSTTASSQFFNRRTTVSLSGNFGEIRLGRDYKPSFWNLTNFDPFGTNGAGTALIQRAISGYIPGTSTYLETSNVRANNTVGYFLPSNLGGFYGQVQYAFPEAAKYDDATVQSSLTDATRTNRYFGGRFGYANGPLDVALSYGQSTNSSSFSGGYDNVSKNLSLGASYDFGPVKLFGQYANVKNEYEYEYAASSTLAKLDGYLLGVTVPVGAGQIKASYGHVTIDTPALYPTSYYGYESPKADQLAVGYVHNLSKRTALYATVAYIKNKNGADFNAGSGNITTSALYTTYGYLPKSSIGYDFGIRHSF
ncbi:MAG: porin [Xenophilus sp.]